MVDNSRNLAGAVEQDAIDIAFIAGEPRSISAHLSLQSLGNEPLVLVCASHIASAQQAAVALGVLPEFISYDQRSNTFQLIEAALSQHNVHTQPAVYSTSPEVTLYLVRQGRGAAVLPYQTVESLLASGELSLLSSGTLGVIARPISAVQRRDKLLPQSTNRLVRQVRRALASAAEAAETAVKSVRE
jgi:DNA-binding transcriptional LysR family regulator